MRIGLLFPHQVFKDNPLIDHCDVIYLIEDDLYFSQYHFHKQKLVLHRASMKYYADMLGNKLGVVYVDNTITSTLQNVFLSLNHQNDTIINYIHTDDYLLERRINRYAKKYKLQLNRFDNPNFIETEEEVKATLQSQKSYLMANFYISQRKKYGILLEEGEKPAGGKWSFDAENRKRVPKGVKIPEMAFPLPNKYVEEAIEYVDQHFSDNYGNSEPFNYPVTFDDAENHLYNFINQRLELFGDYEDAIVQNENYLWHSVLTPMLNIGLLSPKQIINEVIKAYQQNNIPLNNVEGFIRQIIGWREFIRGIYLCEGVKQRTANHFGYSRKIPASFWKGETGIDPIDVSIKKLLKTGYSHHIERLMIFGNFFLLCEFDPDEVYQWFMEMYVDAYDWVMVPNVYGMTQYGDGGLMTTKPYCSGSNYILKMSDYKKGPWCEIWDALYWRFIYVNKEEFAKNRRMSMMVNLVNKMDQTKLNTHLQIAENYLNTLDAENENEIR
jgi:deoxyribodipyrimidine photolyase-related protein